MTKKKSVWLLGTAIIGVLMVGLVYSSQWPAFAVGRWQDVEDSQIWIELRPDHTYTSRDRRDPERTGSWRLMWGTLFLAGVAPARYHFQLISDRILLDDLDSKGLTVTYKMSDRIRPEKR